jgi:hypothetical protein
VDATPARDYRLTVKRRRGGRVIIQTRGRHRARWRVDGQWLGRFRRIVLPPGVYDVYARVKGPCGRVEVSRRVSARSRARKPQLPRFAG